MADDDLFPDQDDLDPQTGGSNAIEQIRAHNRDLEKQLKAERKQRESFETRLSEFETKEKELKVTTEFTSRGLNPKLAELFLAKNQDPTPEAIESFVTTYGFAATKADEPKPEEPKPEFYEPTTGATAEPQPIPRKEIDELMKTNPAEAMRLIGSGRVKFAHPESQALLSRTR